MNKMKDMNKTEKKRIFNEIIQDIKDIKIQGARNIAKKALYAYLLIPTKRSKKKLLSLRPTEPLLRNVLGKTKENSYDEIMGYFDNTQKKINQLMLKIIKNNDVIFTHCHSSTVSKALVYTKKKGKKFEIYATETRPLYQGRKTIMEMRKAGIKATFFIDSAAQVALTEKQGTKKATKFFIGADALLKDGIVNKIGSSMFVHIAHENKIPVYIFAGSWKFTPRPVKMEQRSLKEIWKKAPSKIKIKNPAFSFVPKKYIKVIVSEFGILPYDRFLKRLEDKIKQKELD